MLCLFFFLFPDFLRLGCVHKTFFTLNLLHLVTRKNKTGISCLTYLPSVLTFYDYTDICLKWRLKWLKKMICLIKAVFEYRWNKTIPMRTFLGNLLEQELHNKGPIYMRRIREFLLCQWTEVWLKMDSSTTNYYNNLFGNRLWIKYADSFIRGLGAARFSRSSNYTVESGKLNPFFSNTDNYPAFVTSKLLDNVFTSITIYPELS